MSGQTLDPGEWGPFEELAAASNEIFRLRALLANAKIDPYDPQTVPVGHLVFRPDAADEVRGRAHKMIPVSAGGQSADIDEPIAPLVEEVWKAGVRTLHSCQDNPTGYVWIETESAADATRFVDIALSGDTGDAAQKGLRERALRQGPIGFWPLSRGLWLFKVSIDNQGGEGPVHTKFLVSIRFPRRDLPLVLENFRRHNGVRE